MDLDELKALLVVADVRSMQAAARELGWPRATVRRRIDSLEARVGVPLLYRDKRGANLTDAGQIMVERGRAVIRQVDAMIAQAASPTSPMRGDIRAIIPVGLPPWLIGQGLQTMSMMYPDIRWRLTVSANPLKDAIANADVLVHFGPQRPAGEWLSIRVAESPMRLLASPTYLEANGTPTTIEELQAHCLLSWELAGEAPNIWRTAAGESFEIKPLAASNDLVLLREAARAGAGIGSFADGFGDDPQAAPGSLVEVMPGLMGTMYGVISVPEALQDLDPMASLLAMVRRFAI